MPWALFVFPVPRGTAGRTHGTLPDTTPIQEAPCKAWLPPRDSGTAVVLGQYTASQGFCGLNGVLGIHVVAPGAS